MACDSATALGRFDDAICFGLEAVELNDDDRYDSAGHAYTALGFAFAVIDFDRTLTISGSVPNTRPTLPCSATWPTFTDLPASPAAGSPMKKLPQRSFDLLHPRCRPFTRPVCGCRRSTPRRTSHQR